MSELTVCPWPFSEPGDSPNLPTPEGMALGRELARLCDTAEAELAAKGFATEARCDECAFRAGTYPNGCPTTVMDAVKAVVEIEPFYCHKGLVSGEPPKRECAGWIMSVDSMHDGRDRLEGRVRGVGEPSRGSK